MGMSLDEVYENANKINDRKNKIKQLLENADDSDTSSEPEVLSVKSSSKQDNRKKSS
jgi:hypothetical protein